MEKTIYTFRERPVPVNALVEHPALCHTKGKMIHLSSHRALVSFPLPKVKNAHCQPCIGMA